MIFRRYFFLGISLGCLLLVAVGKVEAQCTGYSITGTNVNVLSPTDAAAQGNVTITTALYASNVTGSSRSHNAKYTPGVWVGIDVTTRNAQSRSWYYTVNGGSTQYGYGSASGFSGTQTWKNPQAWLANTSEVGQTITFVNTAYAGSNLTGDSTQDRLTFAVVAGNSPSIVSEDHIHTNAYYQLVSTFGGGSMMNNCGECQGGETQPCLQATHTPLFDAAMTNPQSGETQTISNAQAGNVAKATESVSGTASIMISVLPGDHPTGSTTNKIYCTMFGWIMAQQWSPGVPDFEWAVTEVETIASTCTLALRFFEQNSDWGVQCNVAWKKPPATADRCTVASQVPDFNPETVWDEQDCKIPGDCGTADLPPPNGTNQNFPKFWYAASQGVRFGGPPAPGQPDPIIAGGAHGWRFPLYVLKQYIPGGPDEDWWILDLLNIAVAKGTGLPIDCANRDKGTYPIQTPW